MLSTFKKVLLTILIVAPIIFSVSPVYGESSDLAVSQPVPVIITKLNPDEYVEMYATLYGAPIKELQAVMACESQGNPTVVGDSGRAYGLFQYHRGTFEAFAKEMGEPLDYHSYHDQIKLTAWIFSRPDAEKYKRHWTTYVALKNGGTYSFYSKVMQKHYTVHCGYV